MKEKTFALVLLSTLLAAGTLVHAPGTLIASPPPSVPQVSSGTWASTAPMAEARTGAASVLLPDGRVLVTGGMGERTLLASTEFYDSNRTFSPAAPMHFARRHHTAVVLQDGRVLVAGGETIGEGPTNSVEIYDPASDRWTIVNAMAEARAGHTATLLANGQVLVAGGWNARGVRASLELFDPATESFRYAGTLSSPRKDHAASALADGRVLIAGGSDGSAVLTSVDIFDPASGSVSSAANLTLPRAGHSATLLLDGNVLVAGGTNGTEEVGAAEVYDAAGDEWTATGNMAGPRRDHIAFLLPHSNNVLIIGGIAADSPVATAELYGSWKGVFTATGSPAEARVGGSGSPLAQEGLLLVAGGSGLSSAELYGFATVKTDKEDYAPSETVAITGSGWVPGETVDLLLQEVPPTHADRIIKAKADASGNIFVDRFSPNPRDGGVTFYLTAIGAASQAQTRFTDKKPPNPGPGPKPPKPTTTTVTSDNNPSLLGQSVTFTATVAAAEGKGTPSGTVQFKIDGTSFGSPVSLGACGTGKGARGKACASISTSSLAVGSHTVQATYLGDSKFLESSGSLSQTVTQPSLTPTTTEVVSSLNPSEFGDSVTFTAGVSAASGAGTPTGTVTFFDDATALATETLQPGGWTTFTTSSLSAGAHPITAVYDGDDNFSSSTSAVVTQTVNHASTSTALVSSQNPSLAGEWVTFTAIVNATSGAATATGNITFLDGPIELATKPLQPGGWATFNTPDLAVGSHSITAKYNGDSNFAPSTSAVLTQTVNPGSTSTQVVSSQNPSLAGEWVTFTAVVSVTSGTATATLSAIAEALTPTGTVTFFDGSTSLATAPLQPGGWATLNTPDLAVGSHSITAKYNGDSNFAPSTSAVLTQTVNPGRAL